jgi:histidinol-phosphate/aromatic aminotransferase/cobyric acid decarboxylase-like protein
VNGKLGIVFPTFEEYPNRALAERIVKYTPDNADFAYTAQDIQDYYGDKEITTLLLINPDNPSGNFIPKGELVDIIEWAREHCITLIVDESFVDFTDGFEANSLLHNDILERYTHLVVVKSISKSYGVPGLRLGILASSDQELIARMKKEVAIWNINSFAEFYMQIFGKYEKDYTVACHKFLEERELFFEELKAVPFLRVIPSQANYFLCEVTAKYTATELTELLLKHYNILIKDCGTKLAFAGKQYIRIAIRDRADNTYFVEALKELA